MQTSESDLSTNRYKKKSTLGGSEQPWWLKEDEAKQTGGGTKSFIKKPKLTEQLSPKKKLGTTLESDEFLNESRLSHIDLPKLNFETNSIHSAKLQSHSNNNNYEDDYEEDENEEEEETSTVLSSPPQSKRNMSENLNKAASLKSSLTSLKSTNPDKIGKIN